MSARLRRLTARVYAPSVPAHMAPPAGGCLRSRLRGQKKPRYSSAQECVPDHLSLRQSLRLCHLPRQREARETTAQIADAREEQAPPLRRNVESKMGFSLGRSCLRSRLMRGKYVRLIRHDFVAPPSSPPSLPPVAASLPAGESLPRGEGTPYRLAALGTFPGGGSVRRGESTDVRQDAESGRTDRMRASGDRVFSYGLAHSKNSRQNIAFYPMAHDLATSA